jgi:hypothetical protein
MELFELVDNVVQLLELIERVAGVVHRICRWIRG